MTGTSGIVEAVFPVQEGNLVLSLIDQSGRIVKEVDPGPVTGGEFRIEIDISGLQNGMYYVVLKNGATFIGSQQLVIAR